MVNADTDSTHSQKKARRKDKQTDIANEVYPLQISEQRMQGRNSAIESRGGYEKRKAAENVQNSTGSANRHTGSVYNNTGNVHKYTGSVL